MKKQFFLIVYAVIILVLSIVIVKQDKKIKYYRKMWDKESNENIRFTVERARLKMYDYIFNYMDAKYPDIYAECYDVAKWANPYYQETNK